MKTLIFATLLAFAAARPDKPSRSYAAPGGRHSSVEDIVVVRENIQLPGDTPAYSVDVALSNGAQVQESGYGSGPDGAVESQGEFSFVAPDGEEYSLKWVADAEGGFQPQGAHLPVAPAFPHPIPKYVLDQIAKAAAEDAAKSSEEQSQRRYA